MSIKNFWQYVTDRGWKIPSFPQDAEGNYLCPFCNEIIPRRVEMDKVPNYEIVLHCPRCGEVKVDPEE